MEHGFTNLILNKLLFIGDVFCFAFVVLRGEVVTGNLESMIEMIHFLLPIPV